MEKNTTIQQAFLNNKFIYIGGTILLLIIVVGYLFLSGALFGDYKVTLVNTPNEVATGSIVTFTWKVDGPATTIKHTAVHYGTESTPGELGKEVKPSETKYTDFVKDFADGNFKIPLQFVGNAPVTKKGKYFFRAHAEVNGKNYWSNEYSFNVKPAEYKVTLIQAPKEMQTRVVSTFTWRVDGEPTAIDSTGIYFGLESNPEDLGKEVKPSDADYKYILPDFVKGAFNIPLQFVGNLQVNTPGVYYYRVHANIKGDNFWSQEQTFEVK